MADPPPPVAQPDELSPLDYLLHRGDSHPATRSAFLTLEILDRPADWGRLREALGRTSRVVIRMPGHHSGPGVDGYLDRTDFVPLRQDLPDPVDDQADLGAQRACHDQFQMGGAAIEAEIP